MYNIGMNKNKCASCGGMSKCSCKNKDFTKAVVEIDNPGCVTLMRKVTIPASMGNDTTVPPVVGKYHNVLLYYEANSKAYLYSSDGVPTQLVNGVTDYEAAVNLPQINGVTLLGDKSTADLKLVDAPMVITVADGNTSWSGADTAEDVYNFFLNKGKVNIVFNGGENYAYEVTSAAYIPEEEKMMCILAVATMATEETTEFDGNALFGTMTLYTADKAIDVSQIELQPKLFIADFTGLDLNYNELSGVPATTYSIGMVKPGEGLGVDTDGEISIKVNEVQSDWDEADNTKLDYIKNKPTIPVESYSTSEVDTGTTWIDDFTIYKKTVDIGELPDTDTKTVAHGITGFIMLIDVSGSFSDGTNSAPLPYSSPTTTKNVQVYVDDTNISIVTGEDRSSYSGYVTLYYTKIS